jgi:hypothetical protein
MAAATAMGDSSDVADRSLVNNAAARAAVSEVVARWVLVFDADRMVDGSLALRRTLGGLGRRAVSSSAHGLGEFAVVIQSQASLRASNET